jgi:aminoglycoside 6-adenylyltransferase
MTYEELEVRIAAWAQTQPAVRAVIAGGSRARPDHPADRWSDLDVMIFTTERNSYAAESGWLGAFGELWLAYSEPTARGDAEWYAIYDGGLKLDAVLLQVEDATLELEALMLHYPYQGVFGRGVKVLYDRLGAARMMAAKPFTPPNPPTQAEFGQVVSGFLMAAATTAKFIMREDFWRAQNWFAQDLRPHLITMIGWRAYGKDVWYGARFIEQWADPRALAALPQIFPLYERESLQNALLAILDLFRWVSQETGPHFGYSYPAETHHKIAKLIEVIFREDG